jgi:enamine deaminase RidA (YjgF/YER057c/UK114 family)
VRSSVPVTDRERVASGSPFEPSVGFSRAMRVGERVIVSGTGPVVPDGACPVDPAAQTRRCFEIVATALAEVGASLDDVVRTRLYLTNVADAGAVGEIHRELFGDVRPAATMIVVSGLLDPAWKVEVEAEAVVPRGDVDDR